jgi:hypothetical protein
MVLTIYTCKLLTLDSFLREGSSLFFSFIFILYLFVLFVSFLSLYISFFSLFLYLFCFLYFVFFFCFFGVGYCMTGNILCATKQRGARMDDFFGTKIDLFSSRIIQNTQLTDNYMVMKTTSIVHQTKEPNKTRKSRLRPFTDSWLDAQRFTTRDS